MNRQRLVFAIFLLACVFGFWYLRGQLQTEVPQVTRLEARPELLEDAPPTIELLLEQEVVEEDAAVLLPEEEVPLTTLERMELEVALMAEAPPPDYSCVQTPIREVTESAGPRIYQWRDEQGRLHFGDTPPPNLQSTEFDSRQGATRNYFQLSVEFRGGDALPYFRGQIESQATSMYEILADLLGDDRLKQVDMNVIIFSDNTGYRDYAASVGGSALANAGGFYSNASNEAVTYLYEDEQQTLAVSRHEAAHVILNGLLATGPLWLHEGLAEYFELLSIEQQATQIAPSDEWLSLARTAINTGYFSDLALFLDASPEQWRSGQEAMNYALAWSLVYYMLDTNNPDARRTFTALLQQTADAFCTEISSSALMNLSYPGGLAALQVEFSEWVLDEAPRRNHYY